MYGYESEFTAAFASLSAPRPLTTTAWREIAAASRGPEPGPRFASIVASFQGYLTMFRALQRHATICPGEYIFVSDSPYLSLCYPIFALILISQFYLKLFPIVPFFATPYFVL